MRFNHLMAQSLLLFSVPAWAGESYGTFQHKDLQPRPLAQVLATAAKSSEASEAVLIEGQVKKVCEKKGCWMTLEDKGQMVRVVFKGYSFFVPAKLEGQKVVAEGRLKRSEQSVAEQKHLLEDAGAPAADIAAVKSSKTVFEFEASAVKSL